MVREVASMARPEETATLLSHAEEGGTRKKAEILVLLKRELDIDDDKAKVVFCMPELGSDDKSKEKVRNPVCCMPESESDDKVKNPVDEAKKMFNATTLEDLESHFGKTELTKKDFTEKAQKLVKSMIYERGFSCEEFLSIDGDMTFVKIDCDETLAKRLAIKFCYALPFSTAAYEKVRQAEAPSEEPLGPPHMDGHDFPAYQLFDEDEKDGTQLFEPFKGIDYIRLVVEELRCCFNLEELKKAEVVSKWFPSANHAEMEELSRKTNLFFPVEAEYHEVRKYFGEQIAFFFRFHGFYIKMLVFLILPAAVATLVQTGHFFTQELSHYQQNYCKCAFGVFLVVWATVFHRLLVYKSHNEYYRWGMNENKTFEIHQMTTRSDRMWVSNTFGNLFIFLYLLAFVYAVLYIAFKKNISVHMRSYAFTGVTFLFSFVWGQLAPKLAEFEGHSTESRYNAALTRRLAYVKLFLFLFPLCNTAFLEALTKRECAGSHAEVIHKVFNENIEAFAALNASLNVTNLTADHLEIQEWGKKNLIHPHGGYAAVMQLLKHLRMGDGLPGNQSCMKGCLPKQCSYRSSSGEVSCLTTCYFQLQTSLSTLFVSHLVCSLLFVIIGMGMVSKKVFDEEAKQRATKGNENKRYTFLQFQEKCFDVAPYEYLSWGGSYVEDFLEVVLSFAVLSSFGVISPYLAVLALVFQIAENRLLMLRMTHVTCRPYPAPSEGIGPWTTVLDAIVNVSIVINGLLIVLEMRTPMEFWAFEHKFSFFSAWTMSLIFFRLAFGTLLPDESPEFIQVNDFNSIFKRKIASLLHADLKTVQNSRTRASSKEPASSVE